MKSLYATEYRIYTFTNFYLSSIANGIQPMHVLGEMTIKYAIDKDIKTQIKKHGEVPAGLGHACRVFTEWVKNHKTAISLNGGPHAGVVAIYKDLEKFGAMFGLPVAAFFEEAGAIAEAPTMTSCGIVVPNSIYNAELATAPIDSGGLLTLGYQFVPDEGGSGMITYPFGTPECELVRLLKSCPLAR